MVFKWLSLLVFVVLSFEALGDDFYKKSDIRCDGDVCYLKENNKLFEGEIRKYNLRGYLWYIEEYKDGKKHGQQKYFYDDGNVKSYSLFKEGKKHGIDREYYNNGKIKEEKEYNEGVLDGFFRKFYENGKLKEECSYDNDVKEDRCRSYYEEGGIKTDVIYDKGKVVSSFCISKRGRRSSCDAK